MQKMNLIEEQTGALKSGSLAFIYNITGDEKTEILRRFEGKAAYMNALTANNKISILNALNKALNTELSGKATVVEKTMAIKEQSGLIIIIDNAEYLQRAGQKFLEELKLDGATIIMLSAHPRFEPLMKTWDIYNKYMVCEIDIKK